MGIRPSLVLPLPSYRILGQFLVSSPVSHSKTQIMNAKGLEGTE